MNGRPVCLLTGSAGTLGTAFCDEASSRYEIAALWHRRRPPVTTKDQQIIDPLDATQTPLDTAPVHLIHGNVASRQQIPKFVGAVLRKFGRIDLIVNAAVFTEWGPLLNGSGVIDGFDRQFRVNVRGPLLVTAEVARQFWSTNADESANRSVVNLSSTASLRVYPGQGQSIYGSSKAALNLLTKHMAEEFGALGVRVNALAPNSFPGRVPMSSVLQGIEALAEGAMTGRVLALDEDGWEWH